MDDFEIEVQGLYYGGWEMVTTAETQAEAKSLLADYRSAEPGTSFRIKKVYVGIDE